MSMNKAEVGEEDDETKWETDRRAKSRESHLLLPLLLIFLFLSGPYSSAAFILYSPFLSLVDALLLMEALIINWPCCLSLSFQIASRPRMICFHPGYTERDRYRMHIITSQLVKERPFVAKPSRPT